MNVDKPDRPEITLIKNRGSQHKGDVHVTNYYRLALHSAVLYGSEVLASKRIQSGDTSLATDIARGNRALSPDKIDYVDRSTLIEIADSIYHTIAYILECPLAKQERGKDED